MLGWHLLKMESSDGMDGRQQMLMNELELIMTTSEDVVLESCMDRLETSLGEIQNGIDVVASAVDCREQSCDPGQIVMEKPNITAELLVDGVQSFQIYSDSVDLSSDKSMAYEVAKPSEAKEVRSSGDKENCDETQLKEMECEKPVSTQGTVPLTTQMLEDEDIEEGEISGDVDIDFGSMDWLVEDAVIARKMEEKQVSKEKTDKREIPCSDKNGANKGGSGSNPFSMGISPSKTAPCGTYGRTEVEERDKCIPTREKKSASEKEEFSSKEKLDAESSRKNKRIRSEKSKAQKKQKERKKRAEKNRLLGVKRLKLKPIVKPKTVTYCRHYLKGRCHEGEACKFSHDTTPLTKSSPCCHFARQSCMKGDDCPFDHELSKYQCTNFATKGFCNRGANCVFSHKDSASSASKLQTAPSSMLGVSHSKDKPNTSGTTRHNVSAASFSFGVLPHKNNEQTMGKTLFEPKGVSPRSFGKPPCKPNLGSSSTVNIEHGKVKNQTGNNASNIIRDTSDIPITKPSVAPKGISFLSFGKTSLEDSDSKKLASLACDKEDAAISSPLEENSSKVGYQSTTRSVLCSNQNSNEKRKTNLSTLAPKGISFLSFGRDSIGTSQIDKRATANSTEKTPMPLPHKFPASVSSSGQLSNQFAAGDSKAKTNSTQRTLLSALKFAAEFESVKKQAPNNSLTVNNCEKEKAGVVGGPKNSSSKVLEFLSSFSSKTRQQ